MVNSEQKLYSYENNNLWRYVCVWQRENAFRQPSIELQVNNDGEDGGSERRGEPVVR